MNQTVFQAAPLVEVSMFQKLLRQQPQENAVIQLNNLLSAKPVRQVSLADVRSIEAHYGISLKKEFSLNLEEFYATYLNFCLADKSLSREEMEDLKHLKLILFLDDESVSRLHAELGKDIYKKSFEEAVADGRLTEAEESFLGKLEAELMLPKELVEKISIEVRSAHLQAYTDSIVRDQRISPTEERELQAIAKSLNVNIQMDDATRQQFQKLKLYWALENLPLPTIQSDIALQKGEECYFSTSNVNWYEPRVVRKSSARTGVTFRVAKGFYLHAAQPARISSTEQLKLINSGAVYLTNKRIIFIGQGKNSNIRLDKIVNFVPYTDGVEIGKDTGRNPTLQLSSRADIFCITLERVLQER